MGNLSKFKWLTSKNFNILIIFLGFICKSLCYILCERHFAHLKLNNNNTFLDPDLYSFQMKYEVIYVFFTMSSIHAAQPRPRRQHDRAPAKRYVFSVWWKVIFRSVNLISRMWWSLNGLFGNQMKHIMHFSILSKHNLSKISCKYSHTRGSTNLLLDSRCCVV